MDQEPDNTILREAIETVVQNRRLLYWNSADLAKNMSWLKYLFDIDVQAQQFDLLLIEQTQFALTEALGSGEVPSRRQFIDAYEMLEQRVTELAQSSPENS